MSPPPRAGSHDGNQSSGGIHHLALVATHLSASNSAASTSAPALNPPAIAPPHALTPLDANESVNSLSLRELIDFRQGLKEDFGRIASEISRMERLLSRGNDHLRALDERIQVVEAKSRAPVVWEINSAKSSAASSGEGSGSEKASAETMVMEKDFIEFWGGSKSVEAIKLSERPKVPIFAKEVVAASAGGSREIIKVA